MSQRIARHVMNHSPAVDAAYRVHLVLASLADEGGFVLDVPQTEIARFARTDKRTVQRALRWLQEQALISAERGPNRVNRYQFAVDYLLDDDEESEPDE